MCWTNPIPRLFSLHIPPSSDNVQARLPAPFRSSRLSSNQWGDQEFFIPMQLSADFHNSVHQVPEDYRRSSHLNLPPRQTASRL